MIESRVLGPKTSPERRAGYQTNFPPTTLHSTLQKYNNAAAAMIPPKPSLNWDAVTHPDFPSTVELLRGRDDIRSCEWTQEHFRAATRAWQKL